MPTVIGQPLESLDSPQAVIDLDVVDRNVATMLARMRERPVNVRVHFKSLKCGGLARYLANRGVKSFLCAKLNEAEVLAQHGVTDIFIANQIVGPQKIRRLTELARRTSLRICVDDPANFVPAGQAMHEAGLSLGVLLEVDIGMARCGVDPGEPAVAMAWKIAATPGLRFMGLQGYDGHLQMIPDIGERKKQCLASLEKLVATRRAIEAAGIPVEVVTGAGTGTWEFVGFHEGITEIQPGSFVLMDNAYHDVQPQFSCALSIMATVISCRPGRYVVDAGSKAISKDFGTPVIANRPKDRVLGLSEEHTKVECHTNDLRIGDRVAVLPTHGCATMNLHRQCIAVRGGKVEAVWPIEASGRYD